MTAVLHNLRQLEAANRTGALSEAEYEAAKARLLSNIEDAQLVADPEPELSNASVTDVVLFILMVLAGLCLFTALVAWAIGDLTLALTVSITLLAALTIHAFHKASKE
jgi:hypothetical protein